MYPGARYRGMSRSKVGGASADADAVAWAGAVTANGGTYSAATLAAVSTFVKAAKTSGYWTKLNRINLFCGDQLAAALVPLKVGGGGSTDTNVNFVSGDYSESTGLTGDGTTKYLKTGLIPSTSLALNDTHMAVYNRSSTGSGTAVGCLNSTSQKMSLTAPFSDSKLYSEQYNATNAAGQLSLAITTPYGFLAGSRTASNAHAIYRNGSSIAASTGSGGSLPTVEMYVFGRNDSGALAVGANMAFGAYSVGSGLTSSDITAYNTHMEAFQDALGRGVQ